MAAVWFGGLIAAINLAQLARRLRPSARGPGPAQLMAGAAERFLFTLTAFGIAIATLHLAPLPLLAGFAGAQFGYLIGPLDREHAS